MEWKYFAHMDVQEYALEELLFIIIIYTFFAILSHKYQANEITPQAPFQQYQYSMIK